MAKQNISVSQNWLTLCYLATSFLYLLHAHFIYSHGFNDNVNSGLITFRSIYPTSYHSSIPISAECLVNTTQPT